MERPVQQLVSWGLSTPGSPVRLVVSRDLLSARGRESWGQPALEEAACFTAAFLQAAKISQKQYRRNCTHLIYSCFRKRGFLASSPAARTAGSWPASVGSCGGSSVLAQRVMLCGGGGLGKQHGSTSSAWAWFARQCKVLPCLTFTRGALKLGKHGPLSCSGCSAVSF